MTKILIQISDRQWTVKALHLACAIARNTGADVVLVHLVPVQNPGLLGISAGNMLSLREQRDLEEYATIAQDYGLTVGVQVMEYLSRTDALVQDAEVLQASALFARLPQHLLPILDRLELWNLRRRLTALQCQLYTLDQPVATAEWSSSVHLKPS